MAVLTVGAGETYETLSAALAAAGDGDTIVLQAGTYDENVAITQDNLTITGDPAAPGGAADVVLRGLVDVNGSDLSLEGFSIETRSAGSGGNDNLIDARDGSGLSLDGMIVAVSKNQAGELMRGVWSKGDLTITDTVMTRAGNAADTGAGRELVRVEGTDSVTFTNSDISGQPVNVNDVTVTDDGAGNAKLTFPNGESIVLQGTSVAQFSSAASLNAVGIPCFTSGTFIQTPRGQRLIDHLRVGDLVSTCDNGPQPIRWIGKGLGQHCPAKRATAAANHSSFTQVVENAGQGVCALASRGNFDLRLLCAFLPV
ncbi:Hint domain-containing protein [Nereida sp. MMG025]|uniref:Hint domain-containing protein n=1 Tax=Nereida sp. MMG025 TaxID=2909981 RepID=UPI001F301683|nr:Hint domain-containing protein [Nereida sp. MMG025]MCF6444127.1 Hint domain-containing protein [Nereida sp. MMG025]